MLVPVDPSYVVGPLAGGAALCFIGSLFVAGSTLPRQLGRLFRKRQYPGKNDSHRCRYCHREAAELVQEKVSRERDQVIEVRFYVCHKCGLPYWIVRRVPISELARW
jgi:uncharacterized protein with PIN domain